MKRTLAMLFALIITLSLCVLTGCKEAKNYTVKEVDGKKRIFLNQNEIDRIEKEIEEKGYSITPLKGFEDEDYGGGGASKYLSDIVEKTEVGQYADFIARCRLVKERQVTRFDRCSPATQIRETYFGTIYTMRIKKLFYSDGDEKEDDIITAYFSNNFGFYKAQKADEYKEDGLVVTLCNLPVPEEGIDFYIFLQRGAPKSFHPLEKTMIDEAVEFFWLTDFGIIYEIEPGKYELNRGFTSLMDGAYPVSEEDPSVYGLGRHLKTDDMDERVQAMVDKYKNED